VPNVTYNVFGGTLNPTLLLVAWLTDVDRERRDGDREFRGRDEGDDKTLGDWRRKEDAGGRVRRGMCFSLYFIHREP